MFARFLSEPLPRMNEQEYEHVHTFDTLIVGRLSLMASLEDVITGLGHMVVQLVAEFGVDQVLENDNSVLVETLERQLESLNRVLASISILGGHRDSANIIGGCARAIFCCCGMHRRDGLDGEMYRRKRQMRGNRFKIRSSSLAASKGQASS